MFWIYLLMQKFNEFCRLYSTYSCFIISPMFADLGRIMNAFLLNLKKFECYKEYGSGNASGFTPFDFAGWIFFSSRVRYNGWPWAIYCRSKCRFLKVFPYIKFHYVNSSFLIKMFHASAGRTTELNPLILAAEACHSRFLFLSLWKK